MLNVEAIHPDAMYFSDNLGFAIRLIHDSATGSSAIAKKIDTNSLFNKQWMSQYVKGFISGCKLIEVQTSGNPEIKNNGGDSSWYDDEAEDATATLQIQFTNAAWFEHLSNKSTWKSTAYPAEADVNFMECPPVNPSSEDGEFSDDYKNSGGWVAIKPQIIPDYNEYTNSWPEMVYIPKYSQKSYRRANKLTGTDLTPETMNALLYKTVFVLTRLGIKTFGILIPQEERYGILRITTTGRGTSFFNISDIFTIGLAEFNIADNTKAITFEN